jgi:hypothetical protein
MIKTVINFYKQIEKEGVDKVSGNAEESIIPGFSKTGAKVFSAADLWNIQRRRRVRFGRRDN